MSTQTTNIRTGFVCSVEDLPEDVLGQYDVTMPEGRLELIVVRQGRAIRAWMNVCPHQGRVLNWAPDRFLRDEQGHLVCAAHGAVFELDGGVCINGPCRGAALTAVPLKTIDGAVFVAR